MTGPSSLTSAADRSPTAGILTPTPQSRGRLLTDNIPSPMLSEICARIEAVGAQFLAYSSAFGAIELAFKADGYPARTAPLAILESPEAEMRSLDCFAAAECRSAPGSPATKSDAVLGGKPKR